MVAVRFAESVEQASLEMKRQPADLVVVNLQINDNTGVELLARVRARFPQAETVALSRVVNSEVCVSALRAGAADLLMGQVSVVEVKACLEWSGTAADAAQETVAGPQSAFAGGMPATQQGPARDQPAGEFALCHDLVKAYQELAEQLKTRRSAWRGVRSFHRRGSGN